MFDSGPLLFQFAHMAIFLEQPWQDALRWVNDHRAEIFVHATKGLNEQDKPTASPGDQTPNS